MMQSASLQCCLVQYWHLALESQNLFAKGPKENKEGLDLSTAELRVLQTANLLRNVVLSNPTAIFQFRLGLLRGSSKWERPWITLSIPGRGGAGGGGCERSRQLWLTRKLTKVLAQEMGIPMPWSFLVSLTRNTATIILPLFSILWLWFCKIPFCRGLASQARDAASQQSSLVLSPSGDKHSGPSEPWRGRRWDQPALHAPRGLLLAALSWEPGSGESPSPMLRRICSGFLISLLTETKCFCPKWNERFHQTKTNVPQMLYSGQT